jgi:catechol 2,3-dioxygenase-like lactoylglutathione lyase family enzyme
MEKNAVTIKFAHNVVFVKDINVSKQFYAETLGINIILDYTVFVLFENNFAIHQAKELIQAIYKTDRPGLDEPQGRENMDFYFESDELDMAYQRLIDFNVEIIHPIEKQSWGQRVFRFYDPDHHIVEIGEPSFVDFDGGGNPG